MTKIIFQISFFSFVCVFLSFSSSAGAEVKTWSPESKTNLAEISIRFYGTPDKWQKIALDNHIGPPYDVEPKQPIRIFDTPTLSAESGQSRVNAWRASLARVVAANETSGNKKLAPPTDATEIDFLTFFQGGKGGGHYFPYKMVAEAEDGKTSVAMSKPIEDLLIREKPIALYANWNSPGPDFMVLLHGNYNNSEGTLLLKTEAGTEVLSDSFTLKINVRGETNRVDLLVVGLKDELELTQITISVPDLAGIRDKTKNAIRKSQQPIIVSEQNPSAPSSSHEATEFLLAPVALHPKVGLSLFNFQQPNIASFSEGLVQVGLDSTLYLPSGWSVTLNDKFSPLYFGAANSLRLRYFEVDLVGEKEFVVEKWHFTPSLGYRVEGMVVPNDAFGFTQVSGIQVGVSALQEVSDDWGVLGGAKYSPFHSDGSAVSFKNYRFNFLLSFIHRPLRPGSYNVGFEYALGHYEFANGAADLNMATLTAGYCF